jgi:hypothetical protein
VLLKGGANHGPGFFEYGVTCHYYIIQIVEPGYRQPEVFSYLALDSVSVYGPG